MKQGIVLAAGMMAAALVRGEEIKHRFLVSDFMHCAVHYVDQTDASKNWTLKLPEITFDLQLIGGNKLLCNRTKGYDVYDLATRQKVDSFQSDSDAVMKDVRSVRRLADGRTFVGTQGGTVYEFDAQKNLTATYEMPKAAKYVRLMRFTPKGTLLLAAEDGAYEVSLEKGLEAEKRLVRKFALPRPRNSYMALYAPNGNLLVSGGYSKGLYTYDAEGKLLKDTVITQPEGLNNYFYASFQILKNGHVVMANWTGHSEKDFKPGLKVVELDKDHNLVWSWNEDFGGTVNHVLVLDGLDTGVLNDDASGVLGSAK
jgi:WD40 repeat protein